MKNFLKGLLLGLLGIASVAVAATVLNVPGGGTGVPSFPRSSLLSSGSSPTSPLQATTTPYVNSLVATSTATSTFVGGISAGTSAGGLSTANGLTITGGNIKSTGTATSTFTAGINVTGGCLAISGSCIGGSGSAVTGSGVSGQITYWSGANTVTGDTNFLWDSTNKIFTANYASTTALSGLNLLSIGTTATSTIQGTTSGTSTLQGFLNVSGSNSTSTFTGFLSAVSASTTATSTSAGEWIRTGGLRIQTLLSQLLGTDASGVVVPTTVTSPITFTSNTLACSTCLTANQSITLSGDVTGSGATSITTALALNVAHAWTALQQFVSASSTSFSALDALQVGRTTATTTIKGDNATSTFAGGVASTNAGGVSSANGVTITGGNIKDTSTATSTFAGGVAVASNGGLSSSVGLTVTGGDFLDSAGTFVVSSGGNVGVGTLSPGNLFSIVTSDSNTTLSSLTSPAAIQNSNTTANNFSALAFQQLDTNGAAQTDARIVDIHRSHTAGAFAGDLIFQTGNAGGLAERMRLTNQGLGIGQTLPTYGLDVTGTGHFTSLLDASYFIGTSTSAFSTFAGGVGAATSTPLATLSVGGSANGGSGFDFAIGSAGTSTLLVTKTGIFGFATSSPSANIGFSTGTTTVVAGSQFAVLSASTTGATAYNIDWNSGNEQDILLKAGAAVTIVVNSTSSHPYPGGRYILNICQDPNGAGAGTVSFPSPVSLRWGGITPATTTMKSTAGMATVLGFDFKTKGIYQIASTTAPCI